MLGNFNINHNWGIFGFAIDTKFSWNYYLLFKVLSTSLWIGQVWSINHTLHLRHGQKHECCFYWIVYSTDIFKKVNLALLAYQNIVGVGSVNCATYLWHVPKLRQCLCVRVSRIVLYGKCDSNWLVCKLFKSD